MVIVGLTAYGPNPAAAQAEVDGCTAVPDSGPVFDFTDACLAHDGCYIDQPYGSSPEDRLRCDTEFRAAMIDSCLETWPRRSQFVSRGLCYGVAWVYYLGVRALGGFFWEAGEPTTPLAA